MNYDIEFGTVDIILNSNFETRAVDAFAIALMKVERQTRRIFTYLIYQHANYKSGDGTKLRQVLFENRSMYLRNFIKGIDNIYSKTVEQIYGIDYQSDYQQILTITNDRNKIFHGQLTDKNLTRNDLIERVELMKKWCKTIATNYNKEIGFDGFERNAYRKSENALTLKNENEFESLVNYKAFLASLKQ